MYCQQCSHNNNQVLSIFYHFTNIFILDQVLARLCCTQLPPSQTCRCPRTSAHHHHHLHWRTLLVIQNILCPQPPQSHPSESSSPRQSSWDPSMMTPDPESCQPWQLWFSCHHQCEHQDLHSKTSARTVSTQIPDVQDSPAIFKFIACKALIWDDFTWRTDVMNLCCCSDPITPIRLNGSCFILNGMLKNFAVLFSRSMNWYDALLGHSAMLVRYWLPENTMLQWRHAFKHPHTRCWGETTEEDWLVVDVEVPDVPVPDHHLPGWPGVGWDCVKIEINIELSRVTGLVPHWWGAQDSWRWCNTIKSHSSQH